MQTVLHKWKWTELGNYKYATPEGDIDLCRDGDATIVQYCERAWQRQMWSEDERGNKPCSIPMYEQGHPGMQAHVKFMSGPRANRRAAVGCTLDHRAMASMLRKQGKQSKVGNLSCMCGDLLPDRRHWAYNCTALNRPLPAAPRCDTEGGLATRFVPHFRRAAERTNAVNGNIYDVLKRLAQSDNRILAAADGGVRMPTHKWKRAASWGIAIDATCIGEGIVTVGGPVPGCDQSTKAAELHAAATFIKAAAIADVEYDLLIDNLGVQRCVDKALLGTLHPQRYAFGTYAELNGLAKLGSRAYWIPSHEKRKEQFVPPPHLTEGAMRRLNNHADEAATNAGTLRWVHERSAETAAWEAGKSWENLALHRLVEAETAYIARHLGAQ